ncbi:hypothetical protein LSG31_14500 [Fodinisporobacter ferrooxydans]|uniref:Uncharacterized protein n=1 Tax=Fodinisporobacter ferrooxydans TaxID=2901836 RepID=A0ABY4CFD7_9BACL|nr:hypothetical protein LSG31_14500 [Alicyclobacillaceae bacterium MYW30-H2]
MDKRHPFHSNPAVQFPNAAHFVFFYEDTQMLLLVWERDFTKALYLVLDHQEDGTLVLDYPGSLFTERLMELVDTVFFIQVTENEVDTKYAIGAYFQAGEDWFGAYYPRESANMSDILPEIVFFKIVESGATLEVQEIEENEHKTVTEAFLNKYREILHIQM